MAEEKFGIENLWKILDVVLEAGNIAGKIVEKKDEDKAWYEKYLLPFTSLGEEVMALFSINYKEILPEFNDLDDTEKAEIYARAVEKFDIPQDEVEAQIERVFKVIIALGGIVAELIDVAKSFKKN